MLNTITINNNLIDDWPDELLIETNKSQLITLNLLKHAIDINDYSILSEATVIPQAKRVFGKFVDKGSVIPKAVKFSDDEWSNRFCRATAHIAIRSSDYKKIKNMSMRNEARVIAASWLWFITNRYSSKLSSIIRKIENLILIYGVLEKLDCESFFDTNNPVVAKALVLHLSTGRSLRSQRNLLLTANSVSLVNSLNLGGKYTSTANFITNKKKSEWNDSNQHYCIPFRIFMEYWRYYIELLNNEFRDVNYSELTELINALKLFYERSNNEKLNLKKRANKFELYCRDEIQKLLKKLAHSDWTLMRHVVRLNDSERYGAKGQYFRVYPQELQNWLYYINNSASLCVQTMTGMRDSERKEIKLGGLIKDGEVVGVITTFHKFAPDNGISDIYAAPKYIENIFENLRKLYSSLLNVDTDTLNQIPLSGIHFYEYLVNKKLISVASSHYIKRISKHREQANITITDIDLQEFNLLNPNINDRKRIDREIYVGAPWPFKTHDSRRSIAVHLKRLDLVSTNDLVRQFKHFSYTQTEWYMSGFEHDGKKYQLAEDFCREIDTASAELSASLAMKLQIGKRLVGKGGEQLAEQQANDKAPKIYPSYKVAKSMAKRNKQHLRSLGNGFYCMNGQNCELKTIISSASCNIDCPNMIADQDSIPIWRRRYSEYRTQLVNAEKNQASEATIEFLNLEVQFYQEALQMLGVTADE